MTLTEGAKEYAETHGTDDADRARLTDAWRAGYLQAIDNWMSKARR